MYFRLVCSIETCMVVDEWERMTRENKLMLEEMRVKVQKLEDMSIHNWQAVAIGALHKAREAHLIFNSKYDFPSLHPPPSDLI